MEQTHINRIVELVDLIKLWNKNDYKRLTRKQWMYLSESCMIARHHDSDTRLIVATMELTGDPLADPADEPGDVEPETLTDPASIFCYIEAVGLSYQHEIE